MGKEQPTPSGIFGKDVSLPRRHEGSAPVRAVRTNSLPVMGITCCLRETTLLARILLLKGIRYFKEGSMRKAIVIFVCVLLALGLGMSAFAGGKTEAAGGGVRIGLSFAEFEVERWSREKDRMWRL